MGIQARVAWQISQGCTEEKLGRKGKALEGSMLRGKYLNDILKQIQEERKKQLRKTLFFGTLLECPGFSVILTKYKLKKRKIEMRTPLGAPFLPSKRQAPLVLPLAGGRLKPKPSGAGLFTILACMLSLSSDRDMCFNPLGRQAVPMIVSPFQIPNSKFR